MLTCFTKGTFMSEEKRLREIEINRIVNKYTKLAEGVMRGPSTLITLLIFGIIAYFVYQILDAVSIRLMLYAYRNGYDRETISFIDTILVNPISAGFIAAPLQYALETPLRRRQMRQINKIAKDNPGFDEFYGIWIKNKGYFHTTQAESIALKALSYSAKLTGSVVAQAQKENKKMGIDVLK